MSILLSVEALPLCGRGSFPNSFGPMGQFTMTDQRLGFSRLNGCAVNESKRTGLERENTTGRIRQGSVSDIGGKFGRESAPH